MQNLTICSTCYHVYISLLKQFASPDKRMELVICDDIPDGASLTARLEDTGLFHEVWFVRETELPGMWKKNALDAVLFQHRRRRRVLRRLLPFQLERYRDIYIFHDANQLGSYLNDIKKPYHLIEDSLDFYQHILDTPQAKLLKPHDLKYHLRRLLGSGYFPLGESRYVLDVEVNDAHHLQISLPNVKQVSRAALEESLTPQNRELLLSVFDCPELLALPENSALLLTQPLFADGEAESLDAQAAVYRVIADALEKEGYTAILKPHPRDKADYSGFGCLQLKGSFPVELLNFLPGVAFACTACISSSAALSVKAEKHYTWKNEKLIEYTGGLTR